MTAELTDNGLSTSTLAEITTDHEDRLRDKLGPNLAVEPTESLAGQLINIFAELRALDEEALLAVYQSFSRNGATGRTLDARVALTGTTREGATRSQVDGLLAFSAADTYSAGSLIRNEDTQELWQLTADVTAGGAGSEAAVFEAVDTGPKIANAGTTWTIVTTNPNVTGFTNPTDDAEPGRDRETDAQLRVRQLTELFSQNLGGRAAIAASVSKTINAQEATGTILTAVCYHNPDINPADSDGIPFKAFNLVLEMSPTVPDAATQQAVFDAILAAMGAGGEAYGTDYTGTAVDSEGVPQAVGFDTVTLVDIVVEVDLITSTTEGKVSENIETVVGAEILRRAQADWEIQGRDVLAMDLSGVVFEMQAAGTISGVDGVTVRLARSPASPSVKTKEAVGIRERADFDSTNVTVAQT